MFFTQKKTDNGKTQSILKNLLVWFVIFFLSVVVLSFLSLVPPEIKETANYIFGIITEEQAGTALLGSFEEPNGSGDPLQNAAVGNYLPQTQKLSENPVRVLIQKIKVDSVVLNPESPDVKILDTALLQGAVHYPGSGGLDDNVNIFIFGHSSYLPVVNNKAYKSFNGLDKLQLGDEIKLFSKTREYLYKVTKVELTDENDALIEFQSGKKKLILSTCDSFGKKTDRFVVEAVYTGSRAL